MRKALLIALAGLLLAAWTADDCLARGGRGGGGGGRGGGGRAGGGSRGGGGGRTPSVSRPASRPSVSRPSGGGNAGIASRPAATRPSRPAVSRPSGGSGTLADRPSTRPSRPATSRPGGTERPGIADRSAGRPGRDDVGDFLGIADERPADRLPEGVRDRVETADLANRREQVAGQLDNRADRTHDRLDNRGERLEDRRGTPEERRDRRQEWGDDIRDDIGDRHNNCFTHDWWGDHCHWHDRWHDFDGGFHYWWTVPTWAAFTGWYAYDWGQPYYYDYGSTVVYEGDTVYYQDQPVATAAEYYAQAADIAEAGAGYEEPEDAKVEDTWLPLGVFAVAPEHTLAEATLMLQLAIDREGHIDGTLYNETTDQASRVTGSVDKKTQRAAWTIEGYDDVVVETGIYNLTEEQTSVLVHFGSDRTETWLLVRLKTPADGAQPPANP